MIQCSVCQCVSGVQCVPVVPMVCSVCWWCDGSHFVNVVDFHSAVAQGEGHGVGDDIKSC